MSRVRETLQQKAGKQLPQSSGAHNPGKHGKIKKPKMSYGKKSMGKKR